MRFSFLIAGSVVCAAIGLCAPASANAFDLLFGTRQPSQGAWCARTNTGAGRVDENCIFDSFEACRRTVISGNRGFCTQNRHSPATLNIRSTKRSEFTASKSGPAGRMSAFGGKAAIARTLAECPLMMMWTAPTLRHQECYSVVA